MDFRITLRHIYFLQLIIGGKKKEEEKTKENGGEGRITKHYTILSQKKLILLHSQYRHDRIAGLGLKIVGTLLVATEPTERVTVVPLKRFGTRVER